MQSVRTHAVAVSLTSQATSDAPTPGPGHETYPLSRAPVIICAVGEAGALLCLVWLQSQCFQSEDTQQGGRRTSFLLTWTPGSPTSCPLSRGPQVTLTVSSCLETPGPAPGSTKGRAAARRASEQLFPAEGHVQKMTAGSRHVVHRF